MTPRRADGYVSRNVGDDLVVVPVRAGVANLEAVFTMNGVGAAIWRRIDGQATLADLTRSVIVEFDVSETEAAADVAAFVSLLAAKGLVDGAGGRS